MVSLKVDWTKNIFGGNCLNQKKNLFIVTSWKPHSDLLKSNLPEGNPQRGSPQEGNPHRESP